MKTRILSLLAITALLFVSCSDDDNTPEANDGMVKFSSGVSVLQTRVGGAEGNEWNSGDAIGIYMVGNGGTTVAESAGNIKYTTTSNTTSATFTSTTPIYYPVDAANTVDFIAYHPHNTNVSGWVYPVNVTTQANQSAIDLMVATADNNGAGYSKSNTSAINLKFSHQLAKVILNVKGGNGVTNLTDLAVSIGGMNTTAKFNITTQKPDDLGNQADITPYSAGGNSYEAILLPVSAFNADHVVGFTVGDNTYKWKMSDNSKAINKLEAGKKYTFNVTLEKNTVLVEGSIDKWEDVGVSNGTAK